MILTRDNLLIYRYRNETVHVEPWGANAVRVRATKNPAFPENDWALASRPSAQAEITDFTRGRGSYHGKSGFLCPITVKSPFTIKRMSVSWKRIPANSAP